MRAYWKPILALVFLSPLLTELLSENLPAPIFFTPAVLIFLMTIGYGFPVLIIREIYIRKQLGLFGLFILGIIYGLYNEALIAKTIINPSHSPIAEFALYGLLGDIRFPWALVISYWHSLYAIVFPILLVGYLFPFAATSSWIGKKTLWVLGTICFIFGSFMFFGNENGNTPGTPGQYILILLTWAALFLLVKKSSPIPEITTIQEAPTASWKKYAAIGIGLNLSLFFFPILIVALRLPVFLFIIYFIMISIFWVRMVRKNTFTFTTITLIGLGGFLANAILATLFHLSPDKVPQIITGLIFIIIFIIAMRKIGAKPTLA